MLQKLLLVLATLICAPASGMDPLNSSNEYESDQKRARTHSLPQLNETLRDYIKTHRPIQDIQDIIARGADINAKQTEKYGCTILMTAAESDYADACTLLLEKGANVNGSDDQGRTPLHMTSSVVIGKILLNHRANVNAPDAGSRTPLHEAVMSNDVVGYPTLLMDNGADVDARDDIEWTPLHCAANSGNDGLCKLLIQRRADINAKDDSERTPLHESVRSVHANVCSVLLENGAKVDTIDDKGDTPLHVSSTINPTTLTGTPKICALLVGRGANVNAINNVSKTPLHNVLMRIVSDRDDPAILHYASSSVQTLIMLLKKGAHAAIIPTSKNIEETRKTRIFSTLCTLNRLCKPLGLPRDIAYIVLVSNKELRSDLLSCLLPRIQRNADNNTLPLTLKTIPRQFHGFIIAVIYRHTMAHLKKALEVLKCNDISSIEKGAGKMMYYGIAHQLGASIKQSTPQVQATREPQVELFAV